MTLTVHSITDRRFVASLMAEMIGTFYFLIVIAMTAGKTDLAPLAIGIALGVMIFATGHVSGVSLCDT
jgi:aquaporin Z